MWYAVQRYDGTWSAELLRYATPGLRWFWTKPDAQAEANRRNANRKETNR